jgi:hypothetical protein
VECGYYRGDEPCDGEAVEVLVYCNPLCGYPPGEIPACAEHLHEHMTDHLLYPPPGYVEF